MSNRNLLGRSAALLLATGLLMPPAGLAAQRVWPTAYATRAGESAQETPFTVNSEFRPRGSRNATLIEASTLPFRAGTVLDALSFRRDARFRTESYAARTGRFEMRLGPIHDATRPVAGLRDMWSGPPSRVAFGQLSLPAAPPPGAGPANFDLRIPFALPFTWSGSDLGIDLVFTSGVDTPWRRDATWRGPLVDGQTRVVGSGCSTSEGLRPQTWIDAASAHPGGTLVTRLQHAPLPTGQTALLWFGSRRPTPLPLDSIGLPNGCELHLDPLTLLATTTGAPSRLHASAALSAPVPSDAGLVGAQIDAQWALTDPGQASVLPYVVSDAIEVTLGAPAASGPPHWGRSFWGRGVDLVGLDYTGRLGPLDHVPVIRFEGTFR